MSDEEGALSEAIGAGSFGRYHPFATLGKGGMADVFLAVARGGLGVNKLVVVKRLRANLSSDASFRRMFIAEGRLATRLNHPNVVHTYDVGEENGVYCIAMEYLEGQPLNRILRETIKRGETIDERMVARIASDALSGLQHAHDLADYDGRPLQIVHRDVSPHNIFVTYAGQVKIVDFGIAKAALGTQETEIGVLKGKVAYMSPEQAMGDQIDHRSDLFAMGICLWEMLTQRRLMGNDNAAATLNRLLYEPIPSVASVRANVSSRLDGIVRKALQKDANLRYQSADDFRTALERFLAESGGCRSDQVGTFLGERFATTRAEVQRQVQKQMDAFSKATTGEIAALRATGNAPIFGSGQVSLVVTPSKSSASTSGIVESARSREDRASLPPRSVTPEGRPRSKVVMALIGAIILLGMIVIGLGARVIRGDAKNFEDGPLPADTDERHEKAAPDNSAGTDPSPQKAEKKPAEGTDFLETPPVASAEDPRPATQHTAHHSRQNLPITKPTASVAAPTGEKGLLKVDTYPWTNVYVDGKLVGTTPLINYSLPAGAHALRFENEEQGIKSPLSVTIRAGETTNLKTLAFK